VNLNDELANDRTFLAWLRTAIALFGLGFVVAKIAYLIEADGSGISDRGFYTVVGVITVLCGGALVLVGWWQHRAVLESLGPTEAPPKRWPTTVTLVAVAGSLLLSALLVVSS
jgi:putative membrane protein